MNKHDYQRIIYGTTMGVLALLLLFYMMKLNKSAKILEPKSNFEVADKIRVVIYFAGLILNLPNTNMSYIARNERRTKRKTE